MLEAGLLPSHLAILDWVRNEPEKTGGLPQMNESSVLEKARWIKKEQSNE